MFYLSRGLYGPRSWSHLALYQQLPRWWFLEVGMWTLEITTTMEAACFAAFSYQSALVLVAVAAVLDII